MLPDDARIDFRAGEEGQKNGAEAREKVHPIGDLKADEIAGDSPHHNFDERDRDRNPNGNQGRQKRQSEPQRRLKPDACHRRSPFPVAPRADRHAAVARQMTSAHRSVCTR